jgi:hypothetical protein
VAQGRKIDQRDNFAARFGMVLRSSGIFYVRNDGHTRTVVSLLNYWKLKRGLDVAIVASTRRCSGELLSRESLEFGDVEVINFEPRLGGDSEGSVEIEVFATRNMVIPYAAVVAHYESPNSHSMVHSYARAYSRHEVEDGLTLDVGEEGCWTLRDASTLRSFAIIHNGPRAVEPQLARLSIRRSAEERPLAQVDFALPALRPYESVKIVPSALFPDLVRRLEGSIGFATISFALAEGFTRMLIGHESVDGHELQVTHSNFNYAAHETNLLPVTLDRCFMHVPALGRDDKAVIVYPDCHPGSYEMKWSTGSRRFRNGEGFELPFGEGLIEFRRLDGALPSRIVTGLSVRGAAGRVPSEMSLGVINAEQPPKRLWWGPLHWIPGRRSRLVVHALPAVYGPPESDAIATFSLHSAIHSSPLKATLPLARLPELENGLPLDDIWGDVGERLGERPGYYSIFSDYPGLTVYTATETESGSCSVEHGF